MLSVFPNICSYKARGALSQLAYQKLYNRSWQYNITDGYIQNTLIIYLDVSDEQDWLNRLSHTNEVEVNNNRADVDFVVDYRKHRAAFQEAWQELPNFY